MWEAWAHSKLHGILWWSLTLSITSWPKTFRTVSSSEQIYSLCLCRFLSFSSLSPDSSLSVPASQTALYLSSRLTYLLHQCSLCSSALIFSIKIIHKIPYNNYLNETTSSFKNSDLKVFIEGKVPCTCNIAQIVNITPWKYLSPISTPKLSSCSSQSLVCICFIPYCTRALPLSIG